MASDLPKRASKTLEDVRRLSRGALAHMRLLLLELRAEPPETIPLPQLLAQLVEATESRVSTKVQLTVRGEAQLPPAVHAALYRITQEALNNVVRHAKAANAWVVLELGHSRVRLEVGDDGTGFDSTAVLPSDLGLRTMRERAEEAGAELCLEAEPDCGGTRVVVTWQESG